MRIHTITAAALVALALALTSCSSDDDNDAAPTLEVPAGPSASAEVTPKGDATDDKNTLETSVRAYAKALFGGDGPAGYALVSKRCKVGTSESEFDRLADQGHNDYGQLEIKNIHVDQISGDLARVSYGVGVPQFERQQQPWAREGGTWKWDACPAS